MVYSVAKESECVLWGVVVSDGRLAVSDQSN